MYYTIYPLYNGLFSIKFKNLPGLQNIENIPAFAFLIVDEKKDAVLLDTGFSPDYVPGLDPVWHQRPTDEIPAVLSQLGHAPSKISTVVQTHLHWDHTAGMKLFPNARFYIQAQEFRALCHLNPNEETYYHPDHWLPLLPQIELLEGNYQLKPGLNLLFTGGHTEGHQAAMVQTRSGLVILGGDLPFNYDLLWKMIPPDTWQAFKDGPGKKCYWDDNVLPTISTWLQSRGASQNRPLTTMEAKQVINMGDRFIISHSSHLQDIRSIG